MNWASLDALPVLQHQVSSLNLDPNYVDPVQISRLRFKDRTGSTCHPVRTYISESVTQS